MWNLLITIVDAEGTVPTVEQCTVHTEHCLRHGEISSPFHGLSAPLALEFTSFRNAQNCPTQLQIVH